MVSLVTNQLMNAAVSSVLPRHWESAQTFEEFLAVAQKNKTFWEAAYRTARVPEEVVLRANALPSERRLLVLLEDWCGDAVSTVPLIARLSDHSERLELRVIGRDANPDLMDTHLTRGTRSIPMVIVTDEALNELGSWGPRPRELQEWFYREGHAMEKDERYRQMRVWYARDRGHSTLHEVLTIGERAVGSPVSESDPSSR